jgi:hypothetical protein
MTWDIEYFKQQDGMQPAEVFEDELKQHVPKLLGKLLRALDHLEAMGPQAGGGLVEKCHGYADLWEVRAIFNKALARGLFAFDANRVVLLHGYVKQTGEPASTPDLNRAHGYLNVYLATRRISPEESATQNKG